MTEHLIIFVKAPRPGTVKTRLGLGANAGCAAYRRLLGAVLDQLTELDPVELRFSPGDGEDETRPWLRLRWSAAPQGEGDLGGRLQRAFMDGFKAGAKRVVIIGSDCPYVTADDIREAWDALKTSDLVLGPAQDGGYWLIGLRETHPELFTDMPWSSNAVFSETIKRAQALGLDTVLLRTLRDVDTPEDWEQYISSAGGFDFPG